MSKIILLVEDYDDSRRMLRVYLEMFGYQVIEAANGYKAVECVKNQLPDLILMDVSLPVIDGLTATRQIKALPETDLIPIICLTAHGSLYKEEAIEAGCREIIGKPIDLDGLSKVIERYLQN